MRSLLVAGIFLVLLTACGEDEPPRFVEICPSFGDERDVGKLALTPRALGAAVQRAALPELSAETGGRTAQLREGPSTWCGVHSDVFDVETHVEPLVARPNAEILIDNPIRDTPQYANAQVQGPFAPPTQQNERLVWPGASWSARFSLDLDHEGGLAFQAPPEVGHYVVSVFFQYGQTNDMFEKSDREGHWSLYLLVQE